ncbi:MAG TPA: hypothetical protein VGQ69_14480 [Gemmatimonadales bacterium]|jgi:hypothetical protein|nr:hypothetical protein [Gemmatimonadales bacterium]
MTERSGLRPEHALLLALLLVGADVLLAVLLLLGVLPVSRWFALGILVAGAMAAFAIVAYSQKLRREQRPEWLETQAWRKGLVDKLHQGDAPTSGETGRSPRIPPDEGV